MITTTLAEIRKHQPCKDGWIKLCKNLGGIRKYGKNTPVTFQQIYESNGYDDALWCLRTTDKKHPNLWRHFAVDCAKQVEHLMKDKRSRNALFVARNYAEGQATAEELYAARAAAEAAARAAVWAAAEAAAWCAAEAAARAAAGDAAWAAAEAAAWAAARDAAGAAARDAAEAAAEAAARDAAGAAAWAAAEAAARCAARDAQMQILFDYCEQEARPKDSEKVLQKYIKEQHNKGGE